VQWLKPAWEDGSKPAAWGEGKFIRPHLNQWLDAVVHTYHPQPPGEAQPGIKGDLISKIPNTKRADRVAQVVEHLSNKYEVLSPALITASLPQNKNKQKTMESREPGVSQNSSYFA
jgi:hypothetical protein